jgi:hypothetical protein
LRAGRCAHYGAGELAGDLPTHIARQLAISDRPFDGLLEEEKSADTRAARAKHRSRTGAVIDVYDCPRTSVERGEVVNTVAMSGPGIPLGTISTRR